MEGRKNDPKPWQVGRYGQRIDGRGVAPNGPGGALRHVGPGGGLGVEVGEQ